MISLEELQELRVKAMEREIKPLLDGIGIDFYDYEDIETIDNLNDELEDNNNFDVEIIYYSNAIDYLRENDESLQESIQIALEYGYTLESVNSELLASLLASKQTREDYYNIQDDIEEVIDDIMETYNNISVLIEEYEESENTDLLEEIEELIKQLEGAE